MNRGNQCEDCGMMFQSASELANHKKKFCANSKYGALEQLEKNFQQSSKNRDISKFGKMSLAMQGRNYDLNKNIQNTNQLDEEYRKIIKQIEDEKNIKNKLESEKQRAFRQLQALEKQQQQVIVDQKRNNLQDVIARRQALARQQQLLQKQIRQYQNKKKQWEKSQVKAKQTIDQPYEQGKKIAKINFERDMLQERKHQMELQLNAKRRQKEKLQKNLLKMSGADDMQPVSKASEVTIARHPKSVVGIKIPDRQQNNSQLAPKQFNYSRLNNERGVARPQTQSSQTSKMSSFLSPDALNGTEKILKFNLNKQGKSQQDKIIQSIMAQQYDDLLILSKLPKGSQLYNMKMKQYTQLSKKRMQVQQKAQKQRLQKMKRQFEFEKIIVQKQKQNEQWVNQNRKQFMTRQLQILGKGNPEGIPAKIQGHNGSLNSIVLDHPSNDILNTDGTIPSGVQDVQKGKKQPSIKPAVPHLGTVVNIGAPIQGYPYSGGRKNESKKKDPFGYRISIIALRNYSLKKAIKIKLIIYEEYYHEKDKGMKYEFATIYHDQNLDQQDPFNPHFKNKLDNTGAIAYNESFYIPENVQELYNRNQKQIYLLIIAAEKDEKKITNEPRPYCWYSFKITHFGQIKEGRFTVNLYGDQIIFPYPADMNKMKKKKQEQLTFELEEVLLDEHMLKQAKKSQNSMPQNSNPNIKPTDSSVQILSNPNESSSYGKASIENGIKNNSSKPEPNLNGTGGKRNSTNSNANQGQNENINGSRVNMNYPIKMKNIEDGQAINVNQQYFYSNEKPSQFSHVQLKKPLNFDVSVSALRTLPSYIGPVKLQMSFLDADGSHVLPKQQFMAQVGTDLYNPLVNYTRKIRNQSRIPPSTIIFIRMIAISALDYQVYSLGFSLIYLFLDREGQPIKSNKVTDYFMTSGYYQLPIFWGNVEPKYMQIQQLLTEYPPIPCCSILIGILQNASKISNPMPAYSEKVYNTILFQLDDNQAKLFSEQYKREPIDTNTLISGFLQYKGIKKNYSGQQIDKYLYKTLIFSSQNTKTKLELKWMAQYQQYFGINFVIDKLNIPQTQLMYYYFITVCISPPANYYKKKSFDLNFCRKIDFDVSTTTQYFYDDNQFFINPAYFKNSSLIIQVNRIQIFQSENTQADNNIQGFAYAVIPLFDIYEKIRAVNVMQASIPLFQGDFDANNIEKLQKNLVGFMQKNEKSKKSKSSIDVRLLNGYFMNQFQAAQPTNDPKAILYRNIAPQNMSFENALEDIASILSSNYNLQIT